MVLYIVCAVFDVEEQSEMSVAASVVAAHVWLPRRVAFASFRKSCSWQDD